MKIIILDEEQHNQLRSELASLESYHWNDNRIHARDCGSKVLYEMREHSITEEQKLQIEAILNKTIPFSELEIGKEFRFDDSLDLPGLYQKMSKRNYRDVKDGNNWIMNSKGLRLLVRVRETNV